MQTTRALNDYAHSSAWSEAVSLFESFQQQGGKFDTYMYNVLIRTCAIGGAWKLALSFLPRMRAEGVKPDVRTYTACIQACGTSSNWEQALVLLDDLKAESSLKVDMFAANAALAALKSSGRVDLCSEILDSLQEANLAPDEFSYGAAIAACQDNGAWAEALDLLDRAESEGVRMTAHMRTSAMVACYKGGRWEQALSLFDSSPMGSRNAYVYSAAIAASVAGGRIEQAVEMLISMEEDGRLVPNAVAYASVLKAYERLPRKFATGIVEDILRGRIRADAQLLGIAGLVCEHHGRYLDALDLQHLRNDLNIELDIASFTSTVNACMLADRQKEALDFCYSSADWLFRETASPQEVLTGIVVAARLERLERDPEAKCPLPTERQIKAAASALPAVRVEDLGILVASLAQLSDQSCQVPDSFLRQVGLQIRNVHEQLTWQTVGHLDYGLRELYAATNNIWENDEVDLEIFALLVPAMRRTVDAANAASRTTNWKPEELLLEVASEALGALEGSLLVVESPRLAHTLRSDHDLEAVAWQRMSANSDLGSVSPPGADGSHAAALLRLFGVETRGDGLALKLALSGAAASLPPGAPIWVCGLVEEGIDDVPHHLQETWFADVQKVAERGRAKVYSATRNDAQCGAEESVQSFAAVESMPLVDVGLKDVPEWRVWPGLFAKGGLDIMTAFLLRRIKSGMAHFAHPFVLPERAAVLDFCTGTGIIGHAILEQHSDVQLHVLDADALAIDAARGNLDIPASSIHLGDSWSALPPELTFDWIISNPPAHSRLQDDFTVLEDLLRGASSRLKPGGQLWVAAQMQVPVGPMLRFHGFEVADWDSDGQFVLWLAELADD